MNEFSYYNQNPGEKPLFLVLRKVYAQPTLDDAMAQLCRLQQIKSKEVLMSVCALTHEEHEKVKGFDLGDVIENLALWVSKYNDTNKSYIIHFMKEERIIILDKKGMSILPQP